MNYELLLSCAADIGEQMVICGAEIERVEDSVRRICSAYGVKRIDVFTITSLMIMTLETNDAKYYTQTRRMLNHNTDLHKLHLLNDLSREICVKKPSVNEMENIINNIKNLKPYSIPVQCFSGAVIGGSFSVLFGGGIIELLVAFVVGALLKLAVKITDKIKINQVLANAVCSFMACFIVLFCSKLGVSIYVNAVIIGIIMILIPGVNITNSIRDMISGDMMTGLLRFFESVLLALAIAVGYILASYVLGV